MKVKMSATITAMKTGEGTPEGRGKTAPWGCRRVIGRFISRTAPVCQKSERTVIWITKTTAETRGQHDDASSSEWSQMLWFMLFDPLGLTVRPSSTLWVTHVPLNLIWNSWFDFSRSRATTISQSCLGCRDQPLWYNSITNCIIPMRLSDLWWINSSFVVLLSLFLISFDFPGALSHRTSFVYGFGTTKHRPSVLRILRQ